jgi:hypothetical protein
MKFVYVGCGKADPETAKAYGFEFQLNGPAVDVQGDIAIKKLRGNKTFICPDVKEAVIVPVKEEVIAGVVKVEVDLPDELEDLRAECDKKGIKYHHKAGAAKLAELLEQAA